jgi:hypothetical protein
VVAAGVATDQDSDSAVLVVKLATDGTFDTGFGSNGVFQAQIGGGDIPFSQAAAVSVLADGGRLLIGGVANTSGGATDLMLGRIFHDTAPAPAFTIATAAVAGTPVEFDGSSSRDPDGSVASYSWDFGDGGRATGATPSHTYAAEGDYTVRLTVTDDRGLPATVTHTVTVAPSNQLNPAFLATLSKLGIAPAAFKAAAKGGSIARTSTGAVVSYRDSRAATTTFEIWRAMRGTFSKGHCLEPSRSLHGRRCARYVKIGKFTHSDRVGLNRFHFTGRLAGHKLPPGRYHLRAVPSFNSRIGIAARTAFRIRR